MSQLTVAVSDSISGGFSPFDRLPDDVVLHIFHKLHDAKSLSVCTAICKRFHSLVPQTHSLLLSVPACPAFDSHSTKQSKRNHPLVAFATKCVIRPFRSLLRVIRSKANFFSGTGCTCRDNDGDGFGGYYYYPPAHILRNFREIRRLELRLPRHVSCVSEVCGGSGSGDGCGLRWTAEFGSELQSCVIVGGTSISPIRKNCDRVGDEEEGSGEELRISENVDLKLRVLWTISCLIAASSRHSLLREAIKEHQTVRSVTVTDEIGQGRLTMNAKQIEEMRRNSHAEKTKEDDENCVLMADDRTRVPALKMKMWIAPELELPEEGCVMKGATLVVIRPVEGWSTAEQEENAGALELVRKVEQEVGEKEERVFAEAAMKLMKLKRSYTLEMNSF